MVAVMLLGACAPTSNWGKADSTDAQMRLDLSACKRAADREVAPNYDRRFDADVDRDTSFGGGRNSPLDAADRQQAGREFNRLTAACMADQGYAKIVPKK